MLNIHDIDDAIFEEILDKIILSNRDILSVNITDTQLSNDEIKLIFEKIHKYENLAILIKNYDKTYIKFEDYKYTSEYNKLSSSLKKRTNSTNGKFDTKISAVLQIIKINSMKYTIFGKILNSDENNTEFKKLERLLENNKELITQNFIDRICSHYEETYAELEVYDALKHLGYTPEYEYDDGITPSKLDFLITDSIQNKYYIEVKTRDEQFEEILQCFFLSDYYDNATFIDPEASTRKTNRVIISALYPQINSYYNIYPERPVILVLKSLCDFMGMTLNSFDECFTQNLNEINDERSSDSQIIIPKNLKVVILFSEDGSGEIRHYYLNGWNSNYDNLIEQAFRHVLSR